MPVIVVNCHLQNGLAGFYVLLRGGTDSEFNVALRPQRTYGLLGTRRGAQDGHLDFHTPPQLCGYQNKSHHRKLEKDILSHAAPARTRTRDFSVTSPALSPLRYPRLCSDRMFFALI